MKTFWQTVKKAFAWGLGGRLGWMLGGAIGGLVARIFGWIWKGAAAYGLVYSLANMPDFSYQKALEADRAKHAQQAQKAKPHPVESVTNPFKGEAK